jgi:hypothetical protein
MVDITDGHANLLVAAESLSNRLRFPQYASAISPDGKASRMNGTHPELVLIDSQGLGERVLLQADGIEFLPADWSVNGRLLLVVKRGIWAYQPPSDMFRQFRGEPGFLFGCAATASPAAPSP